eukprot:TRINITY_DN4999_c1_g2_i1.p1 TRINITY_DN4999_c1_g2~~TRINITY_DN4999_c1_g2_i1.p1  ORF type:complete len:743 (+),score=143.18 TRINITY_DN4999_c1_g2_i1:74-2230(+)
MGLLRWLVRRVELPGDSAIERRAKEILVPVLLVVGVFCGLSSLAVWGQRMTYYYTGLLMSLIDLGLLAWVQFTQRLPISVVEMFLLLSTLSTVLGEWGMRAAMSFPLWPFVVLVMDIALAIGIRLRIQFYALSITVIGLIILAMEDTFRLGLYDIDGWTQADETLLRERISCSDPPCSFRLASSIVGFCVGLIVLFVDYHATRGFAEGMQMQTGRLIASVNLAEQIADSLARFDLESAQRSLDDHNKALPEVLSRSFSRLLGNLASYRPYLPQSCLATDDGDGMEHSNESANSGASRVSTFRQPTWDSAKADAVRKSVLAPNRGRQERKLTLQPARAAARLSSSWRSGSRRSSAASDASPRRGSRDSHTTAPSSPSLFTVPAELSPAARRQSAHRGMNAVTQRRLTLLHCNRRGLLAAIASDRFVDISSYIGSDVAQFAGAVAEQNGIVDMLSADHLSASFGALRPLATHRLAAARCAHAVSTLEANICIRGSPSSEGQLKRTTAVSSGKALCGDFGSALLQRFMVVGPVSAQLPPMERLAAAWGLAVLVDDLVREDSESAWDYRLRLVLTFPKRGQPAPFGLWELAGQKLREGGADEWMYELEAAQPNPWLRYNEVLRTWCAGQRERALELAGVQPDGRVGALVAYIERGDAPPTGELGAVSPLPPTREAELSLLGLCSTISCSAAGPSPIVEQLPNSIVQAAVHSGLRTPDPPVHS